MLSVQQELDFRIFIYAIKSYRLIFEYFHWCLGSVVWQINGYKEYIKVIIVHPTVHFFSFVFVMYLNIASYLYGKQIKSKLGTKLYLFVPSDY